MSNRYNNQSNKKGYSKIQEKFIPKQTADRTFSGSFRQSMSSQTAANSGAGGGVPPAAAAEGRIKMGDNAEWVPTAVMQSGSFVNYLPQDEAVAAGLGADEGGLDPVDSQRVVDLLNRELARLLKLKPKDFWKEVARDTSLHSFVESFLKYKSRWYDFPYRGAKGVVAGVIVGEHELCRRVFMLLYRISSNRDPGARTADSLSPKDHAALLQEKRLLDLPKLLDICAIYGPDNEDLTRLLVLNSIKAQRSMHDEFIAVLSHFLSIIHTMYERCSSSLEVLFSSGYLQDGVGRLHLDYLEVMDFINDAVVTIDAFVDAYKPAAVFFSCPVQMSYGNEEMLVTLARLHDSLLPSLQRGLNIVFASGGDAQQETTIDMISDVSISLKLLSMRIVNLGWKLLYFCYLSDEASAESCPFPPSVKMLPANVDDPVIRADILVQTLKDLNEKYFYTHDIHCKETFLQDIEKNHKIMSRVGLLQTTGWIFIDDQQFHFLSGMLRHPQGVSINEMHHLPSTGTASLQAADEGTAILESKISQIKDLFPDYGKGFLTACLEAYNQNPEEVIQRILDCTLHKDLQSLDISLEEIPQRMSVSSGSTNEKGKGKLLESAPLPTSDRISCQPEGPSNSSSSSVGRYTRKAVADLPDSQTLDSRDEKYMSKNADLISQLEYEDEYDDSFDDLGLSVGDVGLEETESLGVKEAPDQGKPQEVERGSSASKWNTRRKPQFYVKDGKNYSYKVEGSIAVANYNEASLVNQAQRETIHGLGRGGNIPLGAVRRLSESNEEIDDGPDASEGVGRASRGNFRGRGRRGGGRNRYRKDQAMKKHFSGLTGV